MSSVAPDNSSTDQPSQSRLSSILQWGRDFSEMRRLPSLQINLMRPAALENHPFYLGLVDEFYRSSYKRHPRFPLMRQFTVGVATCVLQATFDEYFSAIEASARRNVKKARRLGYEFRPIDFNSCLSDVAEIRRSTDTRQGRVSEEFLSADVKPTHNPTSTNPIHCYPYFGVVRDGKLLAYAGCFICGEVCLLEHIYGHAEHHSDGVVPLLITGIAEMLVAQHPVVKYYCYGTFFGARQPMRRFKRKFSFHPHRVTWRLGS